MANGELYSKRELSPYETNHLNMNYTVYSIMRFFSSVNIYGFFFKFLYGFDININYTYKNSRF